ncbi:MAG: glycosyltransferase, partial [Muribaculaceae bacterium]|nr:glycosyltransferase [Muribaculaceae bacterium]
MYFSFEITQLQWSLLQVALALVLVALGVFTSRILAVNRAARRSAEDEISDSYEDVAVIVYSNDDAGDLASLLPRILEQDYPAGFEIIVVNEGDSPAVREIVSDMQMTHSNLYLTSTPDGARNLSRKKLAITLGIKATRMPVVVLTTADTVIPSDKWLRTICRHFITGSPTEVVLGYAAPPPYEDKAPGTRARSFDHVADSAAWISPAIKGKPWRGTGHNIAYRRDLFFRNKGFSRHLNLRDGDDDIFVSEITRPGNTMIELSPDARVEVPGANSPRAYRHRMARRRFTERFIS